MSAIASSIIIHDIYDTLDLSYPEYLPVYSSAWTKTRSTTYADTQPITLAPQVSHTGFRSLHYVDDFYYRVHVIPNILDMGYIPGTKQVEFSIWNAHFDSKTLTSITEINADGTSINTPAPYTYGALEIQDYIVTATNTGAVRLNAEYEFIFATESPSFIVTGLRTVIWSHKPNYIQPVIERISYKTDILRSKDGTEQRIKTRENPRIEIEFRQTAFHKAQQNISTIINAHQGRYFIVPLFSDQALLTAGVASGSTVAYVDTQNKKFTPGQYIVFWRSAYDFDTVEIATVNADSVTFAYPITTAWETGTETFPAVASTMNFSLPYAYPASIAYDGSIRFQSIEAIQIGSEELTDTTYRSYPLLDVEPNRRDDLTFSIARDVLEFDTDHGVREWEDTLSEQIHNISHTHTLGKKEDSAKLVRFFGKRAGKLTPIWVPTWTHDLTIVEDIPEFSSIIKIENIGYADFLVNLKNRRDIEIVLKNGTVYRRRITGATILSTEIEELDLDATINVDIATSEIERVSYLQFMRLNTDTLEVANYTQEVAEASYNLIGVHDDV